jgi:capsular exopolysaccharide synthesis family protein
MKSVPGSPAEGGAEVHDTIPLLEQWRILVRRRAVVATSLCAVVALTAIFTLLATPHYRATATLQIERHGPDILTFKDVLNVDPAGYADFYQTQYKILQSRAVLRLAAERIDLTHRPEYSAREQPPVARMRHALSSWLFPKERAKPTAEDELDEAVAFLATGLSIDPVRKSYLVRIAFTDREPALAAEIANTIAEAYQQFTLEARYTTTAQASEFLTKQVAQLQAEITAKERRLQEYGAQKEILAAQDDTQDISAQALAELNAEFVSASARLALAEARHEAVRATPPEVLPEVVDHPLIRTLRQQYADLERAQGQMAERFQPDWPARRQLEEELRQARERLEVERHQVAEQVRSAAESDFRKTRAEMENLRRRVDEQKLEVRRVNADAIDYASVQTEIETMRSFLTELVNRQSQTELSDRLRDIHASNVRLVDRAEIPERPVSPRKALNLLLSVVVGLLVGVGAALLLDHVDNTVKSEQDVQRLSGLPVLGHVPVLRPQAGGAEGVEPHAARVRAPADVGSHLDPRSGFAEAFKNLRTSILLAVPDRPPRHILVTSCEPADGKSTVAVNLAIVLAQLGRRVLLVDADLRRPSVHRMLHLDNRIGLSSFLTGNAELHDVIVDGEVQGLKVVTSGPVPPTPSELLGSAGLELLLSLQERGQYDHVIFDSPPLVSVTDPIILSARMDSTIVVVRAGKTSRETLVLGVRRLLQSRAAVIGAVLNAVSEQAGHYYTAYGRYGTAEHDATEGRAAVRRSGRRVGHG